MTKSIKILKLQFYVYVNVAYLFNTGTVREPLSAIVLLLPVFSPDEFSFYARFFTAFCHSGMVPVHSKNSSLSGIMT